MDKTEPIIVVGGGLSGLATALAAATQGRPAVVLEAADLVGGAAAYSGGQVWCGANHVAAREGIEDSLDLAETYIRDVARHLAPETLDDDAFTRWLQTSPAAMKFWEDLGAIAWTVIPGLADYHNEADGALPQGRYLTNEVIDGSTLGPWREKLRYSPYFPVGTTYRELLEKGRRATYVDDDGHDGTAAKHSHAGLPAFGLADDNGFDGPDAGDPLTYGTGVVASFLRRVLAEPSIDIRLAHRVTALLQDVDGAVSGVRASSPAGDVEFRGPVVLATSTYDWDPEAVSDILGLDPEDWGSVAPESIRGDGLRLARSVGGELARIPANATPILPGWRSQVGTGFGYGPEYAMPHSMIVDRSGRRYCNDSYWVDICRKTLDPDDRHLPFFLIWDDQHRRKYGLAATPPGGEYPEGWVQQGATLAELGEKLGIDGAELTKTAHRFSGFARDGKDPDFGRGSVDYVNRFAGDPDNAPSPVLGPIEEAPFYGIRLRFVGTGIGTSGVHIDGDGHVLDRSGAPIDGLYAAGSVAALTTTGTAYNSGIALGRGLTLAYLIGHELAGKPIPRQAEPTHHDHERVGDHAQMGAVHG
ncbi:FAD-dependent oxidoreductase [Gordonia sp. (in: high G+C Gram-positive bacteria)]|uniref:FAD-dependent oxidoreductase n=1 Tax=Gordonia sp. (in: high G+C Gram-positive bacteria) TaxID=84139 RepID=UPI003C73125F